MGDIVLEKLCGSDYKDEEKWILTHARFCRMGDIIRIKNKKNILYTVDSLPTWLEKEAMWDIKLKIWKNLE